MKKPRRYKSGKRLPFQRATDAELLQARRVRKILLRSFCSALTDALQPVRNNCTYAVGGNYEIKDYVYGTLTVQSRPITVKTGYVTKVYDSLPLNGGGSYKTYYYGDESAAGLLGNDRLTLEFNDSIINVWENKPNESR